MKDFSKLVTAYKSALDSFQASKSTFKVLETIYPTKIRASDDATDVKVIKTLFILDSSFNPPTIAHANLARSALTKSVAEQYAQPCGLLLLLSTTNADKAPKPASFQERLAMMIAFGQDLMAELEASTNNTNVVVPISVGVTTAPYYADKSVAIANEGLSTYASKPKHVHLLGFDTLTRFFTAKYYKDFDPPFSALNPYFDNGHCLRVTLRPDEAGGTADDQRSFVDRIADGAMENNGAKRLWTKQIELVPPSKKTGVSSTKIRSAVEKKDWATLSELCTPGVAEFVQALNPYEGGDV